MKAVIFPWFAPSMICGFVAISPAPSKPETCGKNGLPKTDKKEGRNDMEITREMLQAATAKAVELGILPRRSQMEDLATNAELMQEILEAALSRNDGADGNYAADERHATAKSRLNSVKENTQDRSAGKS